MQRRTFFVFLALFALATVAGAGTFTVTLNNGTSFVTRYEPEPASWDETMMLFATDRGNWIVVSEDDIAEITSSVEETGFGYQVNTSTIFVGWSPNDLVEEGEGGEGGGEQTVNENLRDPNPPSFTLQQFVNPGDIVAGQPVDQ